MSRKETGLAGGSLQARSDDQPSGISSEITASAAAVKFGIRHQRKDVRVDLFISKLMKLDRDLAHTLYELLWKGQFPVARDLTLQLRNVLERDDDNDVDAAASAKVADAFTELFDDLFGVRWRCPRRRR